MTPRNTLGAEERLKSSRVITALFEEGKVISQGNVRVLWLRGDYQETHPVKVAFSAPKRRLRMAHDRNRMKRLMREAYRIHKHALIAQCRQHQKGLSLLFISQCNTPLPYAVTEEKIVLLLKRLIQEHEDAVQ